jgi:hypothetical protein
MAEEQKVVVDKTGECETMRSVLWMLGMVAMFRAG